MAIIFDYSRAGRSLSWRRAAFLSTPPTLLAASALWAVALLAASPAAAQYPGLITPAQKTTPALRAVAVLEWTGDAGHPTASRLVPISVFDGQQLQDGGIYLARPQPLALDSEVEYELKQDGKTVGIYDIDNASLVHGAWVGYGTLKPLAKPKPPAQLARRSRPNYSLHDDRHDDSGRPVLHRRSGSDNTSGSGSASNGQAAPPDQGRPTLHRADSGNDSGNNSGDNSSDNTGNNSGNSSGNNSGNSTPGNSTPDNSPPDTDGPTLHRASDDSASTTPPEDTGRPKLRKKKKQQDDADQAYVESVPQLFDSGRPHLSEGQPKSAFVEASALTGLPADMHQEIAVSDASNAPDHPWNFSWANPEDEATMKAALEEIARKDLEPVPSPAPPAAAPKPTSARNQKASARNSKASTRNRARQSAPPHPLAPPIPLLDEQFHVFRLAYDAGATLVFSAHTAGTGADVKYITLIAQPDLYGRVVTLLKNVTDAAHLDLTPRMRLVGPVDATDDNRGELLFELRGATERQFALYRVYGGQVTQLLVTGGGSFAGQIGG